MKKLLALLLATVMVFSLGACAKTEKEAKTVDDSSATAKTEETESADELGPGNIAKKACLITPAGDGMSNPFTQLCWRGFESLEEEGWEVTCIESTEATEYADNLRAMAAEDYGVIVALFDQMSGPAVEIADELYENYPDTKIFLCDSYVENDTKNCANIICDPWEASFVAGYLASNMTEKDTIGWIGHAETTALARFYNGYEAGVSYADLGKTVVRSYTGDATDSVKGEETAKAMIANNDVDIIYQTANTSGIGVISECEKAGVKCIGVDQWMGGTYGQETVFWSALKPIDRAIYTCANMAYEGTWEGTAMYFDLAHGADVYDQRDFDLLEPEMQDKITTLVDDIISGDVDVYEGFEEFRYVQ